MSPRSRSKVSSIFRLETFDTPLLSNVCTKFFMHRVHVGCVATARAHARKTSHCQSASADREAEEWLPTSGRCVRRLSQTKSCWIDVAPAPFGFIVYDSSAYCFCPAGRRRLCVQFRCLAAHDGCLPIVGNRCKVRTRANRLVGNVCFL